MFTPYPIKAMDIHSKNDLLYAHIYNSISVMPACLTMGILSMLVGYGLFPDQKYLAVGLGMIGFLLSVFLILRFIWCGGFVFTITPTEAEIAKQKEIERQKAEMLKRKVEDDANDSASERLMDVLMCNIADMRLGEYFDGNEVPEQYRLSSLIRFVHNVVTHPGDKQLQTDFHALKMLPRKPENHLRMLYDLYGRLI